jgi:hypothetical protein
MAMTLRLSAAQTEALRRRARLEGTSMQDVARRAVDEYIRARDFAVPIGVLIDEEVERFAGALERLGRWAS